MIQAMMLHRSESDSIQRVTHDSARRLFAIRHLEIALLVSICVYSYSTMYSFFPCVASSLRLLLLRLLLPFVRCCCWTLSRAVFAVDSSNYRVQISNIFLLNHVHLSGTHALVPASGCR
jgi:hypothetical protein